MSLLIGLRGATVRELKAYSGLLRMSYRKAFDDPKVPAVCEMVGSKAALFDGLSAIQYHLESELPTMKPDLRAICASMKDWAAYRDDKVEDLGVSKRTVILNNGAIPGPGPSSASRGPTWDEPEPYRRGSDPYDPYPPPPPFGYYGYDPRFDRPPIAPRSNRDNDERYRTHPPDLTIEVPKFTEGHIIGSGGTTIRRIEDLCHTRCSLERGPPSFLHIWGDPEQISQTMDAIDEIILRYTPSWRVGAERQRFGSGWTDDGGPAPLPPALARSSGRGPPPPPAPKPYNQRYRQVDSPEPLEKPPRASTSTASVEPPPLIRTTVKPEPEPETAPSIDNTSSSSSLPATPLSLVDWQKEPRLQPMTEIVRYFHSLSPSERVVAVKGLLTEASIDLKDLVESGETPPSAQKATDPRKPFVPNISSARILC